MGFLQKLQKVVVAIGDRRVAVPSNEEVMERLSHNLPDEAGKLLNSIVCQMNADEKKPFSVATTSDGLDNIITDEILEQIARDCSDKEIRKRVAETLIRRQEAEKSKAEVQRFISIYEYGVVHGLIVGSSTKQDVVNTMKRFSKVDFAPDTEASILYYNDIDLTVYFNENDVVHEFQFGENYEGITSTGIRIGDSLEKAIQILKQPKMRSATGAIWDHFAVFCRNYRIISMRVK